MKAAVFNLLLIGGMIVTGYWLYPQLPDRLPTHWNFRGEIDAYSPKTQALWFLPLMTIGIWFLFQVLPKLDPKKEKYHLFAREWQIIQTGIMGFLVYMYGITLYAGLHPEVNIMPIMFVGLGTLFVLLGNYLSKIRQNYFIGIKVPWTLADEDNWNKTHRFASWCFVLTGLATIIEAFVLWYAPVIIFGGIMLTAVLPMIYSFLLYKHALDKMKYVYLILICLALGLIFVRGISGEDTWLCENGQWVQHGHPNAPQPTAPCP